jgi:hypothetical protein
MSGFDVIIRISIATQSPLDYKSKKTKDENTLALAA